MLVRYLFIFFVLISQIGFGLDRAPKIVRVCLDNSTSVATVCWENAPDPCNSFKSYYLYSSENGGPWILATKVTDFSISCLPIVLSDVNSYWTFKITAHSACNGTDSLFSNTISIDQLKPSAMSLDSLSFDLQSQKLSAGWQANLANDTKGYRLYEYNNSVNNKIVDTSETFKILNAYDKNKVVDISIAAFDSCNLFSPISAAQKAVYLNSSFDTCTRTVSLNWSNYVGWGGTEQYLYVNKNKAGYFKTQTFPSNQNNINLSNITLGDSLCYLIRTKELSSQKTSASNSVCFFTRNLKAPAEQYLQNVSVANNSEINIEFYLDNSADLDSIILEKSIGKSNSFSPFLRYGFDATKSNYFEEDFKTDVNAESYVYRFRTYDKCGNEKSMSNTGTSILLEKPLFNNNEYSLKWNLYSKWENGIMDQTIEYSLDRSTWNKLQTLNTNTTSFIFSDQLPKSDSVCFRIVSLETLNSLNSSARSLSNIRCIYSVSDFYFPGTVNPNSHNNTFKIYGLGYDKSRANLQIFNRWGEMVFETTNLETGWDAKINGEIAPMGLYIYKANFFDQLNQKHNKNGSILIIH